MRFTVITFLLIFFSITKIYGQKSIATKSTEKQSMDKFVSTLLSKMTVEEKIGQLNLLSIGFDITGPKVGKNVEEKIRNGAVGGVFNTYTPTAVKRLQEIAITQSRLKIPLMFGYDVIHGI
jgi:beta-glucosidase